MPKLPLVPVCLAVAAVLSAAPVAAAEPTESPRTVSLETIEGLFGITPSIGAVGDGRMTAQVSRTGTITCLRWPNATFYEHVRFQTGLYNTDPARNAWNLPYFGATANSGIFAGVRYVAAGTATVVRDLRDAEISFAYAAPESNRLVGTYRFGGDLEIVEETYVVPDRPVLIRTYELRSVAGHVSEPTLILYTNPALNDEVQAYIPLPQTDDDDVPRFGTFALTTSEAILTALPAQRDDLDRGELWAWRALPPAKVEAEVLAAAPDWGPGIYLAQGISGTWSGFQVGTDAAIIEAPPTPLDAYRDATDGTLSGSAVAVSFETTAIMVPLATGTPVAWYGAFGHSAGAALGALDAMRADTPEAWATASDAWWQDWLDGAVVPTQSDAARAFGLRALISLRTGMDPESGAIVASTSCQPPYNLDWPRDGAFFQFALELNGKAFEADRHARFYNGLNDVRRIYGPIGSWAMNYYADGTPGGPIDFEIDQVGFGLWVYRLRAAFQSQTSPTAARAFLQDVAESVWLAGDLLVECRDERGTGLQCGANEDDNPGEAITLHGAITAWLGLVSARDIAAALGEGERQTAYAARADELAAAIRAHYHPATGSEPEGILGGALGWSYWPARFWTDDDTAAHEATRRRMIESLHRTLLGEQTGTSYDQKKTMVLAMPPLLTGDTANVVAEAHEVYLSEVASPQNHLGEGTVHDDFDGDGEREWKNVTALPHIWAQTLTYFSLLAEDDPAHFLVPEIVPVADERDGGGGCRAAQGTTSAAGGEVLVGGVVLAWRNRRRFARNMT